MNASFSDSGPAQQTPDLTVGEIAFVNHRRPDPSWRLQPRFSNERFDVLVMCLSGRAVYVMDDRQQEIRPGHLALFKRGVVRTAWADQGDPWEFVSAGFRTEGFGFDALWDSLPNFLRYESFDPIRMLFIDLARGWDPHTASGLMRTRARLLEILASLVEREMTEPESPHERAIQTIMGEIQGDPSSLFRVPALAERAGLSESHFRALFRRHAGAPLSTYVLDVRIRRAKELLLSGEYNVGEAAAATGFRDVYYFSRAFTERTGVTPSRYASRVN